MKIISNPFKSIKDFLWDKFGSLEKKINKDSLELEKIEKELEEIKKSKPESAQNKDIVSNISGWTDKKMLKFWLFALLIGMLGFFVYKTLNIIFLIIWAYIVSIIVESLILRFQSIRVRRWLAILLSYIIFIVVFFGLLIFVVPFLLSQIAELVSIWLGYISWLQELLSTQSIGEVIANIHFIPEYFKTYILSNSTSTELLPQIQSTLQQNLSEIISIGKQYIQMFGTVVINFISWFTSFIVNFTLFITLAILFSVEKESVMNFIARLSGKDNYNTTYIRLQKIYKKLAIRLKARLALSLFITLAMWLALAIMSWCGVEIPNKLWLAIITWLLDIIPYVGPFISWALLFVIWLIYNTIWVAILSIGILFGVNVFQNNILTPLFMNKALWINAVLILISMIIGWIVMWFLWVLLAVPIAVIITLLIQSKAKIEEEDILWEVSFLSDLVKKYKNKLLKKNKGK